MGPNLWLVLYIQNVNPFKWTLFVFRLVELSFVQEKEDGLGWCVPEQEPMALFLVWKGKGGEGSRGGRCWSRYILCLLPPQKPHYIPSSSPFSSCPSSCRLTSPSSSLPWKVMKVMLQSCRERKGLSGSPSPLWCEWAKRRWTGLFLMYFENHSILYFTFLHTCSVFLATFFEIVSHRWPMTGSAV